MSFFQASDWRGCFVVCLFAALAGALPAAHAATYSGGTGIEGDPYLISTVQDLLDLSNPANAADWDKHFRMTNDIDMVGITGFTPIGNSIFYFTGVFDGGGHVIQNLVIDMPEQDYVGLFGRSYGAACHIKNIGLDGGAVTGKSYVGGLVGGNSGTITGCYATGEVSGTGSNVGGLVGRQDSGTITGCYATGEVSGEDRVGGLVGYSYSGTITGCYATGAVTATANYGYVGGLAGLNNYGTITGCFSTGAVSGSYSAGGLVGENAHYGTIIGCYATGTVTGSARVGGLVGTNSYYGTITGCYATGTILGNETSYRGGLVGFVDESGSGRIIASFWDMNTTEQSGNSGGKGLTSAQMKQVSILQNAGWADYGWVMHEGEYPRLAWEGTGAPPIPAAPPVPLSGSGTAGDPYRVGTPEEFALLSWHIGVLDAHILLTQDLDCAGVTLWPIGDLGPFSGVFDGNGKTIANIILSYPGSGYVGTFVSIGETGEIRDLGIVDNEIIGRGYVGGLVGYNDGTITGSYATGELSGSKYDVGGLAGGNSGIITGCYATGAVSGSENFVGGLVGDNSGTITGCYATGAVSATANYGYVGGLVGFNYGTITGCYATGAVSGKNRVGGLVGTNSNGGTISGCYATSLVEGKEDVGGLVGTNSNGGTITGCYATGTVTGWTNAYNVGGLVGTNSNGGTITGCYATGTVTGSTCVGGLVGENKDFVGNRAIITMCYATGAVTGSVNVGGLVGENIKSTISGCYATGAVTKNSYSSSIGGLVGYESSMNGTLASFWDMESTGQHGSSGGKGLTSAQMKQVSIFQNAGWSEYDWVMTDGEYPRLAWENTGAPPIPAAAPVPLSGSGMASDPYRVSTPAEFALLSWHVGVLDAHILLTQDLNCAGMTLWPIGDLGPFSGVFDGNGKTIANIILAYPGSNPIGVFASIGETGEIRDLGIVDNEITGRDYVGGLVGLSSGTITGCYATGAVTATAQLGLAGGLVGWSNGTISGCYTTGTVTATADYGTAGGLVGWNRNGTISGCYATGAVLGNQYVGGLVGWSSFTDAPFAPITNCYATGAVSGSSVVGGLVGKHYGLMTGCYATGAVTGDFVVGGLAGESSGLITDCYATGAVMGTTILGGLVGRLDGGSVTASFWDTDTGGPDNGVGTGLPTAQMQQRATFESSGWDFVSTWFIYEDLTYPQLRGFPMPVDSVSALQALAFAPLSDYFLTRDIDARETAGWGEKSGALGFQPIGTAAAPFNGTLDGRGHRIFGLHIHRPGEDGVGLFGHIGAGGVVRGLGLDQVTITGGNQTGGLAGVNAGTIEQCYVQGVVAGVQEVGGLIGTNSGAVTETYAATTLDGVAPGGLIGVNPGGTVTASFWDTELSGILSSGGGMGLPTGAMQSQSTYQAAGWDMTGTWLISEGISYPYFRNSAPARVVTGPPLLIDAESVTIEVAAFIPGVFVTVGGGAYPAWHKFASSGQAAISVPLKQEAINRLVVSVLSEAGLETIIGRYTVYESAAFPPVPTAVTSLSIVPMSISLVAGGSHQFLCAAVFADGTTAYVTPVANWNVSGGTITAAGLYTHGAGTATVQALLYTQDGWRSSSFSTVTTAKGGDAKSGDGLVSGVVRSHYTGLGLPTASMTVYPVYSPGVAAQHGMYDALGNYAFFLPESIYHFEAMNAGYRSELARGGYLLKEPELIHPGPPQVWSEAEYAGRVKSDRPLQYDFALRPNDAQAPWVYYVEPPASCTVNKPHLVVTAINADKYSELKVATFTLNTVPHDVQNRISTTGFYRNTWELQLGLNVLHLYSMDTETNASERTIEVIYDPHYDPGGYTPPEPEGPPPTACVRMSIVNLAEGMALRGDAVTLLAEATDGDLGAVDAVSFEMRGAGTGGAWVMLGASINAPHTATWNTALWPAGAYQLRAVAVSLDGCVDSDAALVAVTVAAGAAYHERVESGTHTLTAPVSASTDNVLAIQDGARYARILIPAGALASDGLITAFFPDAAGFSPALTPWEQDADLYLDVSLSPHTGNFLNDKRATMEVGYPDADADGVLDDAGLRVSQLRLKHLPGPEAAFAALPSGGISWHKRCVIGETRHFSVFGVVAEQAAPPLNLLISALLEGTAGVFYSAPLEANGGIPPYVWSVTGGALPPGLGINGNALEGAPTAPGEYSFTLQVADAQSIPALASVPLTLSIYAASQPTVSITRADGQPSITNTIPLRWDIVFSEPVPDFTVSDILFRGSAAFGLDYALSGAGAAYTVEVTALPYDGVLHPRVPANVAGNNRASSGEEQVWVDRKAPLLHMACAYGGLQEPGASGPILVETLPVVFTLTFDEAVSGLDAGGIVFDPEVAGVLYEVHGSGKDYTLLVTAAAGACTIMPVVLADAAQDAAGNGNAETLYAGREVQYIPDTRPTMTLNQGAGQADPVNVFPITFDIVFSEAVSGFTVDDVAYLDLPDKAPNPVYVLSGGGAVYTLTVTGADGDGRLGFRVPDTAAWQASTSLDNVVSLDTTPPGITLGAPSISKTLRGPVSFPVQYTGASVVTLGASDVTLHGAPTAHVMVTGTGSAARVVTLSGINGEGTLGISLAAGTAADAAGNIAAAAGPSATVEVSPFKITVARAAGQNALTNSLPIVFDVQFSRDISGFNTSHVLMDGTATVSNFTINGSGASYTLTVTAVSTDGSIAPVVPAGTLLDAENEPNETSTGVDGVVTYDTARPGVTVRRATGQPVLTNSLPIVFDVLFTDPVFGFGETGVFIGGTASGVDFDIDGAGDAYTVTVTAIAGDGAVIVTVPANRCQDEAGNWNTASAGAQNSVTYDIAPPEFVDIEAAPNPAGEGAAVAIGFRASEALNSMPAVTVNNNPADYVSHDGLDYLYNYTVQAGDANGPATLVISGVDLAGNSGQSEDTEALEIDHTKPTANFTASPRTGMPPLEVGFTDLSAPVSGTPITDWVWDFGDGTPPLSGQSPAPHTYVNVGVYMVTLSITDAVMNSDSETKAGYIVVGGTTAAFTAAPESGHAPLAVQFTDTSDPGASPITAWYWVFGDGAVSAEPNPEHTYTAPGVYSVSLAVTTAVSSATHTEHELITVQPGVPPTAAFSAAPTTGYAPLTVQFMDTSDAGTSPITAWDWDFGDGETSGAAAPSHVYATPGVYSVRLTVSTTAGTDTLTRLGYVHAFVPIPPAASFDASPVEGPAPLTVQFTDTSAPGSSPIDVWEWDFGDGEHSHEQHPVHVYEEPGIYTVSLTVTSTVDSDMRIRQNYIAVGATVPASGWVLLALLPALIACCGAGHMQRKRGRE